MILFYAAHRQSTEGQIANGLFLSAAEMPPFPENVVLSGGGCGGAADERYSEH
jgi:hypothetical protein